VEDWSASPVAFDAAVYPSLLVARRLEDGATAAPATVAAARHHRGGVLRWCLTSDRLALDGEPGAPWVLLPDDARDAFERVAAGGVPLAESALGRPMLGVKCGCNDAFVVRVRGVTGALAEVEGGGRAGTVERAMLRPLLRGESLADEGAPAEHIVWTHAPGGAPLAALPPHAARWLAPWQRRLRARADARSGGAWWSLFRTAGASPGAARVVWADVGRSPRPRILPPDDPAVPLNSCYVVACRDVADARALAALLASPLAAAWLGALAEPARGGYHRYLAWTVALLPLPAEWRRARALLAPLADGGASADDLLAASLRAFRLRARDVEPLLAWSAR
jgi:hypothetical protein